MSRRTNLFLLMGMTASAAAIGANYPQPLPTGFSPTSGPPGTVITVIGSGFTGLTQAWIGNAHDATLKVVNDSTVMVTVPADATTAHLGLLNPQNSDFTPNNFTVTSGGGSVTVSGAVVGPQNTSVRLTGSSTSTTNVGSNGRYTFSNVASGAYTVAPNMNGYLFFPAAVATTVAGESINGATFTGVSTSSPTYSISGTISGYDATLATVTLNGANVGSASADRGGSFEFSGLAAGTYTVSATHSGTTFSQSHTVTLRNADSTGNDFSAVETPSNSDLQLTVVATLPQASVGKPYSTSVVQSIWGGNGTYRYQTGHFGSGTPPLGMVLNPNGTLTGTPKDAGTHSFRVCAADTAGDITASCAATSITVGSGSTPPPGTSWVYYNGEFDWPGDYSFVATPDYADTSGGPMSGAHDIKLTLQSAWGGWLPYAKNWNFNSSGYTKLTFALKPTVDNQTWSVFFVKVGDIPVGIYLDVSKYGPAPVKGQWATYTVPLSDLGVLGTDIYKFCIQDQTGLSSNYWYIDNVGFAP